MAQATEEQRAQLRALPSVDELLREEKVEALTDVPRAVVVLAVRQIIEQTRQAILAGDRGQEVDTSALGEATAKRARELSRPGTSRAVNATGVILHTGLGRAPIAGVAMDAVRSAGGYCLLEVDPEDGSRLHRETRVAERLVRLTGAEAATVVNNNAAAVMIVLATIAKGGEVIVSRGELIEIGGSFRVPEVMEQSGCQLREVGATNRVHLKDYERAIGENTRALMKVWPSNFRVIGFHKEIPAAELVTLARQHGLPTMEDLGSGALLDLRPWGYDEPPVRESIEAGVDLVTFSGDKLLGGTQAGIIVGKRDLVAAVRRHPLFRALRPDKLCLAGMDATLALAEEPERAFREIPTLRMMTEPVEHVRARATQLAERLRAVLPDEVSIDVVDAPGRLGSGALPEHDVPSVSVVLANLDAEATHYRLRTGEPAIFARVREDRLWLDCRTASNEADHDDLVTRLPQSLNP